VNLVSRYGHHNTNGIGATETTTVNHKQGIFRGEHHPLSFSLQRMISSYF
jgi:hypothetical protein